MEVLTGIIIGGFIYYTGFMVSTGEIEINSFFSFLTAMMLAYQPIRSLATINMTIYQGAAAAERVFDVIDEKAKIKEITVFIVKLYVSGIFLERSAQKCLKLKILKNIDILKF